MAGSILGADQVAKINDAYPRLIVHIRELVRADNSAYGQMKVHFLTEFLDTTEIAEVFKDLPFLAPAEKRALVRAAIYELLATQPSLFSAVPVHTAPTVRPTAGGVVVPSTFTPPRFSLNVNKTADFHPRAADVNVAKPVVTSTHTPKVTTQIEAGNKRMDEYAAKLEAATVDALKADAEQSAKRSAAVLKLQEAVKPIEVAPTPAAPIDIPQE